MVSVYHGTQVAEIHTHTLTHTERRTFVAVLACPPRPTYSAILAFPPRLCVACTGSIARVPPVSVVAGAVLCAAAGWCSRVRNKAAAVGER